MAFLKISMNVLLLGARVFHIHLNLTVWSGRDRKCVGGICYAVRFLSTLVYL